MQIIYIKKDDIHGRRLLLYFQAVTLIISEVRILSSKKLHKLLFLFEIIRNSHFYFTECLQAPLLAIK